ncbi:MAG: head GIN domain-containing protein [Ferruginibacter sp.]
MKYLSIVLASCILFASCRSVTGSGNIIKKNKSVDNFNTVDAGSSFEVIVKLGNSNAVEIEADDNIMPFVEIKNVNDVLKIRLTGKRNFRDAHLKVIVNAVAINRIKASGAASIKVEGVLTDKDQIKVDISGAATVHAKVDAPKIDVQVSGAGYAELEGRTRNFVSDLSGSASMKAGSLLSETTTVEASGAASAHVHSSVSLKASANGAASVFYIGGGVTNFSVSGAAKVEREK